MSARYLVFVAALVTGAGVASAQSFEADVAPLVQASCVQCHGVRTVTPLSLAGLESTVCYLKSYGFRESILLYLCQRSVDRMHQVATFGFRPAQAPHFEPHHHHISRRAAS